MSTDLERKGERVKRVVKKLGPNAPKQTPVRVLAPAGPLSWGPSVVRNPG